MILTSKKRRCWTLLSGKKENASTLNISDEKKTVTLTLLERKKHRCWSNTSEDKNVGVTTKTSTLDISGEKITSTSKASDETTPLLNELLRQEKRDGCVGCIALPTSLLSAVTPYARGECYITNKIFTIGFVESHHPALISGTLPSPRISL